jgi:hypothetical protein
VIDPPEADPREIAFYSALVDAWINTRMERDKSLLTLSSAGIGLLVTLLTAGKAHDDVLKPWFIAGFLSFAATLLLSILVFHRNANLIRALVRDPDAGDRLLDVLDWLLVGSFLLGVAACVGLGLSSL